MGCWHPKFDPYTQAPMGSKATGNSHGFTNITIMCSLFITIFSSDCPVVFPLLFRMLFACLDPPSTHNNWYVHVFYSYLLVLQPILMGIWLGPGTWPMGFSEPIMTQPPWGPRSWSLPKRRQMRPRPGRYWSRF